MDWKKLASLGRNRTETAPQDVASAVAHWSWLRRSVKGLPEDTTDLDALVDAGILQDNGTASDGPGRPRRWWSAPELLDLVSAWSA